MPTAKGPFQVKTTPLEGDTDIDGVVMGRLALDKIYEGDLQGGGIGEMQTTGGPGGAGVYVALERVTGTLAGRKGSFVLVHRGVMTKTSRDLSIVIAPESGTGGLAGISGTFSIEIVDGKHGYSLDYKLD